MKVRASSKGPTSARRFVLEDENRAYVVGRGEECDLPLADPERVARARVDHAAWQPGFRPRSRVEQRRLSRRAARSSSGARRSHWRSPQRWCASGRLGCSRSTSPSAAAPRRSRKPRPTTKLMREGEVPKPPPSSLARIADAAAQEPPPLSSSAAHARHAQCRIRAAECRPRAEEKRLERGRPARRRWCRGRDHRRITGLVVVLARKGCEPSSSSQKEKVVGIVVGDVDASARRSSALRNDVVIIVVVIVIVGAVVVIASWLC